MIEGKLSLVLPAYNEVENLRAVVERALEVLPTLVEEHEIIIVDDGSRDGTAAAADRLAEQYANVQAVHHARNLGYGAALRSGFAAASGRYIMFMDSDQQFDVADLAFLAPFVGDHDLVAGYRILRRDARHRLIYADIFKLAMRILFGIRLRDIDCAFKVYRADLLKAMPLQSPGALINAEILAKAEREGLRWVEVGVNHYPRTSGTSSGGSLRVITRAMKETLLLWLRIRRYRPSGVLGPDRVRSTRPRDLLVAVSLAGTLLAGWLLAVVSRRNRS